MEFSMSILPDANSSVNPALLTYSEARRALRISRFKADQLRATGQLRTIVIGSKFYVPQGDIIHFLKNTAAQASVAAKITTEDLPWYEAARIYRQPITRRGGRQQVVCSEHYW